MKPFSYYTSRTIYYPSKADYTVVYYYRQGRLLCVKKPFSEIEGPEDAVKEEVFDAEGFNLHVQKHLEEKIQLEKEFKEDLAIKFGLINHSKFEECFSLATQYGSSGGLPEIYDYFEELSNLITD